MFQKFANNQKSTPRRKKFTRACLGLLSAPLLCLANAASALDVVIILDITGSTGSLLPTWKDNMDTAVIQPIKAVDPNARFALVTHLDFPFSPYGGTGEYAYQVEAPLNADTTSLLTALKSLTNGWGGDTKESQYEAIYQANTGLGRDLNGNGSYADPGDILPAPLGFNPITDSFTIHFTSPLDFHNDPFEPDYPFAGVANNPATEADAIAAMASQNNTYFVLLPDPLLAATAKGALGTTVPVDMQTGKPLAHSASELAVSTDSSAARLAAATGGAIIPVGSDLSGLEEAIESVIEVVRPCPEGKVPVELPFGVVCVPSPSL